MCKKHAEIHVKNGRGGNKAKKQYAGYAISAASSVQNVVAGKREIIMISIGCFVSGASI